MLKILNGLIVFLALSLLSSCMQSDVVFPKLGYKYFDQFVHEQYDGKIYIQEDHKGTAVLPSRSFFLFGDMNDTFAGRMNMGPIYIAGDAFQQAYSVWAAPLSGPLSGRKNNIKLYTQSNDLILEEELYFPKHIESVLPDTIKLGSVIQWNADEENPHGILVEISELSDTTLSFDDLGERRAYYYFPQDDGQIKISPSLIKTFAVKSGDVKRFRIYRGNFDQLETNVDYPRKIKFMYWSSVYKEVYFKLE